MSELSVRPSPPVQFQRPNQANENNEAEQTRPGRSGQAVGQLARAEVAAAQEAGTSLPNNAQGLAASQIARTGSVDLTALLQIQTDAQSGDETPPAGENDDPAIVGEGTNDGDAQAAGTIEPVSTDETSTDEGGDGGTTAETPSSIFEPAPLPSQAEVTPDEEDTSQISEESIATIPSSDDPAINVNNELVGELLNALGDATSEPVTPENQLFDALNGAVQDGNETT